MLRLAVRPYGDTHWRWDGIRYVTSDGRSTIAPYPHEAVESVAIADEHRAMIVVRERLSGQTRVSPETNKVTPEAYDRAKSLAITWPADYVLLETADHSPVRVTAGPYGTAPLYLTEAYPYLYASWDLADLASQIRSFCVREASRLLIYRPRYGTETIFQGLYRLTERATAHYGGRLYIEYPEPALHGVARDLAEEADVLGVFRQVIDNFLSFRLTDPDRTVFHLTGGFDSGSLAVAAANKYPGRFSTATLLIMGFGREHQIQRREEIRRRLDFGPHDHVVDTLSRPPLHPDCPRTRGEPISPYDEPLYLPFRLLAEQIIRNGAHTVVTGLGGDEVVALTQEEHPHKALGGLADAPDWIGDEVRHALSYVDDGVAPPAVVNSMTLLSLATAAPLLLRAGLWPVHPFTDPLLIRLGESLPLAWRKDKQLQRLFLGTFGLGDHVLHPTARESFAEVVQLTLQNYAGPIVARMLEDGSPLFDDGLVKPDALRKAARRIGRGDYRELRDAPLLQVLHLHLAAESFLQEG